MNLIKLPVTSIEIFKRKDIAEDLVYFIKEESIRNDCICNNIL